MKEFTQENFEAFAATLDADAMSMLSDHEQALNLLGKFNEWLATPDPIEAVVALPVRAHDLLITDRNGNVVASFYSANVATAAAAAMNASYLPPDPDDVDTKNDGDEDFDE